VKSDQATLLDLFIFLILCTFNERVLYVKGVVHFQKKIFADNLLTPMSFKMSISFFLQSKRN